MPGVPAVDAEGLCGDRVGVHLERERASFVQRLALREEIDRLGHRRKPVGPGDALGPQRDRAGEEPAARGQAQREPGSLVIERVARFHPAGVQDKAGDRRRLSLGHQEERRRSRGAGVRERGAPLQPVPIDERSEHGPRVPRGQPQGRRARSRHRHQHVETCGPGLQDRCDIGEVERLGMIRGEDPPGSRHSIAHFPYARGAGAARGGARGRGADVPVAVADHRAESAGVVVPELRLHPVRRGRAGARRDGRRDRPRRVPGREPEANRPAPSGPVVPGEILGFAGPADQDAGARPRPVARGILDGDVEDVRSGFEVEGPGIAVGGGEAPPIGSRGQLVPGQAEQPVRECRRRQAAVAVIVDKPRLGILLEPERPEGEPVTHRAVDGGLDRVDTGASRVSGRVVRGERREKRSVDPDGTVGRAQSVAPRPEPIRLLPRLALDERRGRAGGDDQGLEHRRHVVGPRWEARLERVDRRVLTVAHLEVQMRQADARFPRMGDDLSAVHPDRGIRVDVAGIARLGLGLPARHQALEVQHGVLVTLEVAVHGHPARRVTHVEGPPVAAPLDLEADDLPRVGRQDPIARRPARRDVDPGVQMIVAVLPERREHAPRDLQRPQQRPARSTVRGGSATGGGDGGGARRRPRQHQHGQSQDHRRDGRRVTLRKPPGEPHGARIVTTKTPGANARFV